jgi:hypothetical protein
MNMMMNTLALLGRHYLILNHFIPWILNHIDALTDRRGLTKLKDVHFL